MDAGRQIDKKRNLCWSCKTEGFNVKRSGRRDIVYQWKARMANTDMGRLEVKAQLTQQRKPTWLVECNCPTRKSWQSDKAVTLVPRRTWLKTDEGEENDPQRNPKENYIGQNCGKKRSSTWWRNKNWATMYQSKLKCQTEPTEWHQSHVVPIKSNTTKKRSATRSSPDRTQQG